MFGLKAVRLLSQPVHINYSKLKSKNVVVVVLIPSNRNFCKCLNHSYLDKKNYDRPTNRQTDMRVFFFNFHILFNECSGEKQEDRKEQQRCETMLQVFRHMYVSKETREDVGFRDAPAYEKRRSYQLRRRGYIVIFDIYTLKAPLLCIQRSMITTYNHRSENKNL